MKKFVIVALCLLLLTVVAQVQAQGLTGKNAITGAAAWVNVSADDEDVSATLFSAGYSRFINENLELKADLIYARAELDDDDLSAWMIAPAVAWNFTPKTPSAIVPYVGVGAVFASIDTGHDDDTSFNFEAFAGARFFIGGDYCNASKAVFLEYRYSNVELFDEDANVNLLWAGIEFIL